MEQMEMQCKYREEYRMVIDVNTGCNCRVIWHDGAMITGCVEEWCSPGL